MDWGEGVVRGVVQADGSPCDGCDESTTDGELIDVRLSSFDDPSATVLALVCEACFEDLTSDLAGSASPGCSFLVLADPAVVLPGAAG